MTGPGDVTIEDLGDIALICIDNPPVNAAGLSVRDGLIAAIDQLDESETFQAAALYGAGRTFPAGADIREFGRPPQPPFLPDVCNRIEAATVPIVAVLHGTALGGGLELALAAHARVGLRGLRLGLPEVTLGILPGAGGTQRAPRLAGMAFALDMITTGRQIGAEEALKHGLIDTLQDGSDPREAAITAARALQNGILPMRRTGEIEVAPDPDALAAARARVESARPRLHSPARAIDAVEASALPLDEGLARERALYLDCQASPQRAGLVHAFFAERAVSKVPEAAETPRPTDHIGVIGAGTMGSGIATAALLAGCRVTLVERAQEALDRGRATIARNLDGAEKRGKLDPAGRAGAEARLAMATEMTALSEADVIVEAAFEDMEVKREIFTTLDQVAKPGAVLATNTSYLDVNRIAAATRRPVDVLGLHFFSPAHVMRLLEVVVADRTAPDAVATGFALAKRLRKVAVRAGVCDGFIGNRIMAAWRKAADYLLMDGADFDRIDRALEDFGFAMGPFAVSDLAGLDIGWAARKRRAPTRPTEERYVPIADRICEAGWFGRKTGRGFYLHEAGQPPRPNPNAQAIVAAERQAAGIIPRDFTDDEIVARYLTATIVEATRVIEEGIALRPIDVDAVLLFGYGFPRHHGGPMHYADTLGAEELVTRIKTYAHEDAHFWQVPPLLMQLAAKDGAFADLNEA